MDIRFRPSRNDDAEPCAALVLDQQTFSERIGGELPGLLKNLIGSQAIQSVVYEELASEKPRLVGFAATGFVEPRWLDLELAAPRLGLVERLYLAESEGGPQLLRPKQIAAETEDSGLNLVFLHYATGDAQLVDGLASSIHRLNSQTFTLLVSGYYCRRRVHEIWEPAAVPALTALGFVPPRPLADTAASPVLVLDSDTVSATAFHPFGFLFSRQPRRLGFSPAQQRQLGLALWHFSDKAIAKEMGISVNTVRKRWEEVFRRAAAVDPELCSRHGRGRDRARGPDRRRCLLAYLMTHMEELRPVAFAKKG